LQSSHSPEASWWADINYSSKIICSSSSVFYSDCGMGLWVVTPSTHVGCKLLGWMYCSGLKWVVC
jgi:hypothetical protein